MKIATARRVLGPGKRNVHETHAHLTLSVDHAALFDRFPVRTGARSGPNPSKQAFRVLHIRKGAAFMSSFSSPVRQVAAVAVSFMALGAIAIASSQGGAEAASTQDRVVHSYNQIYAGNQHPSIAPSVNPAHILFTGLLSDLTMAAEPGNEGAYMKLAKQTCDALPTWGAQSGRISQNVASLVGHDVNAAQLTTFVTASALAYCPGMQHFATD
jgi:hypothetical protein